MLITHLVPKIILLALMFVGLGITIGKHGQPQTKYNGWVSAISVAVTLALLYWSGWFTS